jgi:tetratricopeptide (TPR) repeat protein
MRLLVCVLGLCAATAASAQQGLPEGCLQTADLARKIEECTAVIEQGREDSRAFSFAFANRCFAHLTLKHFDRAVSDCSEAIRIYPNVEPRFYMFRGEALDDLGEYDRAIDDYTTAIKLDDKNIITYFDRGALYRDKKGLYDAAIADFSVAIRLAPDSNVASLGYQVRSGAYFLNGTYDYALADAETAIRLNPRTSGGYFARGNAFASKGQHDLAIADFDVAIKLNAKDPLAYFNRGKSYAAKHLCDLAITDYGATIQLNPGIENAYLERAICYGAKGRNDLASADLEAAIRINPNDDKPHTLRGFLRFTQNSYELAMQDFNLAVELNPRDARAFATRGSFYIKRGENDRGLADLNTAIQLSPNDSSALLERGGLFERTGKIDSALVDYGNAIEHAPNSTFAARAYYRRGSAYQTKGELKLALRDYKIAVDKDPTLDLARQALTAVSALISVDTGANSTAPSSSDFASVEPQDLFAAASKTVYVVIAAHQEAGDALTNIAQGSAVAVSPNRLLTNCHVVQSRELISLHARAETWVARVISRDDDADRCILTIEQGITDFATGRDFEDLRIGERVYSIGTPKGLALTMAEGIVSGLRNDNDKRYIQTTAPISPGSSGGGLFDSRGRLIGITTFMLKEAQNLNFAIPAGDFGR